MRFKQALSRKLAAALSAVMILSTIAPTSVPVLAAAPDDVLVDSAAEYSLTDAGSEDLSTPAESSLAEESDALEVAEEELLTSEPASEETIVEAADIAAETGAEPAETVDVAEGDAPEGMYTITFDESVSKNIITSIELLSWNEALAVPEAITVDTWPFEATCSVNSIVSINQITLNSPGWDASKGDFTLTYGGVEVSANEVIDVNITENLVSDLTIDDTVLLFNDLTYSGDVKYNVTSGNIVTSFDYTIDEVAGATNDTVTVSEDVANVPISLTNARSITFDNINVNSYGDKYLIKVNGNEDVTSANIATYSKTLSGNEFANGFTIVAERTAFDGKVTLNIVSNNLISAIDYTTDGSPASGTAAIVDDKAEIEYENANKFSITGITYVDDSKRAAVDVKIGDKTIAAGATFDPIDYTITKQAPGKGAPITIEGEAKKNTRDVKFTLNVVSNDSITELKYNVAAPDYDSETTWTVSNNKLEINAEDARSIKIYGIVAPKAGSTGTDIDCQGALKITYGGKTEYIYTGDGFSDVEEFKFTKDVEEATLEFIPYVKVTLSGNAVDRITGSYTLNGGAYDGAGSSLGYITNSSTKDIYVEPGVMSLSLNNLEYVDKAYDFPVVKNGATEVPANYDFDMWELGTFDADAVVNFDVKTYKLDDLFKTTSNYDAAKAPLKVSFNAITEDGVTVSSDGVYLNQPSLITDPYVTVPVYVRNDKTLDKKNFYELSKANYKVVTSEETLEATITDSDWTHYTPQSYGLPISYSDLSKALLSGQNFTLDVTQREFTWEYSVDWSNPEAGVVTVENDGTTYYAYSAPVDFKSGSKLWVKYTPHNSTLKSVTISGDKIEKVPAKDLAKFTSDAGYPYTLEGDVRFIFEVEKEYGTTVAYGNYPYEDIEAKKGVYPIIYNKQVFVYYQNGSNVENDFKFDILDGNKSVSSPNVSVKTGYYGKYLSFLGKDFEGKTLTIKIWKQVSDNKVGEQTLKFKVNTAKSQSVKFKKAEETVAIGKNYEYDQFEKKYVSYLAYIDATVKGDVEAMVSTSSNTAASAKGINLYFGYNSSSKKYYLGVNAPTTATPCDLDVSIVDKNDESIEFAKIKLKVIDSISKSAAPNVQKTAATNNMFWLKLTPNKLDTKLANLAYRVNVKAKDNAIKSTSPFDTAYNAGKTFEVPISTKTLSINLLKPGYNEADVYAGDPEVKFDITVTVVQKKGDTTEYYVSENPAKLEGINALDGGIFAKKVNVKNAKGKIYTNMTNEFAFEVGFDKKATVQMLADYYVLDPDGAKVDAKFVGYDGRNITVTPNVDGDMLGAGKYTIVAEALEPNSVAVTGKKTFKVLQAVESVKIDGASNVVYKKDGKAAKITLTAYDTTFGDEKVLKKANWYFTNADGSANYGNTLENITIKNGKITIKKNFRPSSLTLYVKAQAADYKGNTAVSEKYTISVKTEPNTRFELKYSKTLGGDFNKLPASGYVYELFDESDFENNDYRYVTYVALQETGDTEYGIPATFKVSGAKLIGTKITTIGTKEVTVAEIGFTKPGKVKITATATDGSDRVVKNYTVDVKTSTGELGWTLYKNKDDYSDGNKLGTNVDAKNKAKEGAVTLSNNLANGEPLALFIKGYASGQASFINHQVSVTGGKLVKIKNYPDKYYIKPTANVTKITLTNKTKKGNTGKFVITMNNVAIPDKATASTKAVGKASSTINAKSAQIYNHLEYGDVSAADKALGFTGYPSQNKINEVTIPVAAKKAYVTVLNDDVGGQIKDVIDYNKADMVNDSTYVLNVSDNKLKLDFSFDGNFDIKAGTYKLSITPVNEKGAATGATATVAIKAVKVPKAKVNIVKTVDMRNTVSADITTKAGKNVKTDVYFTGILKKMNNKKDMNSFPTNFNATAGKGTSKLSFVSATPVTDKLEFTGWVEYKYQTLDGAVKTDYVKISVKTPKTGLKK